jgi:hypothetical protein
MSGVPSDYNLHRQKEEIKPLENVVNVKPYQKLVLNGVPGSSPMPNTRSNDLVYQQR